jgi:hypothetical protein
VNDQGAIVTPTESLVMPRFADYHRTVIGYYGTQRSTALRIVQGLESYQWSTNADDWLGHGIYFWEYAPKQAWAWAELKWTPKTGPLGMLN